MTLDDERTIPAVRRALALGITALASFALLGASTGSAAATRLDLALQRCALAVQSPAVHAVALGVTVAGGITAMRVLAVGAAAFSWRRRGWRDALAILAMPIMAELLADAAKGRYARPRPAGLGHGVDPTWAFPSAHAAVSAATCAMIAWVGCRDEILSRHLALALALGVPLLVGASRVLLNVHWASDVAGGWCEGAAIASAAIALRRAARARGVAS